MNHNITKLFSRVALVSFLAVAFAGTALAADVTDVIDNTATSSQLGNTATSAWVNAFSITGTSGAVYTIRSMGTKNTTNALQFNANGYLYMTTSPSGYKLKSVTITTTANKNIGVYAQNSAYSAAPSGSALSTLAATSSGATYTFTSDYTFLALKGTASSTSITSVSIVWEEVSSSVVETTTTIDDSGITNTDVYISTVAGSLSASVKDADNNAVSGATVTWSGNNDAVATIDASTGAVTLVSAGTVKFTASYAGKTGEYQASSAEYTMTVTSSAPYTQPTQFDIIFSDSFFGTNYGGSASGITDSDPISGSQDNVTVTYAGGGNHYVSSNQIRFYPSNKLTFEAPDGYKIKSIVFTQVSGGNWGATISANSGTYTSSTKTWAGSAATVLFTGSGSGRCDISKATITLEKASPEISADDVNIAYNAMAGNIAFTINNPASDGVVSAITNDSWLTLGGETTSPISFTCTANNETTARSATVTLTYTYNTNETVTKDVTVTQAAAPVVYSTIPALFDVATTTDADVYVTFNNWVVSGVSTNGKNVFVTDNNGNGFVIFDNNGGLGDVYSTGDILSGTAVSCKLALYNGFAEVKNLTATDLTITPGGTVSAASIAMANLAGVNTGALISYSNLTCSVTSGKYYLSDGTTTLQVYNTLHAFEALMAGKTYNITGVYQQYNSTKEILPRSAADIEEVVVTTPSITVNPATVSKTASEVEGTMDIIYANLPISDMSDFDVQYCDSEGADASKPSWVDDILVAEKDPSEGEGYVVSFTIQANDGAARSAYFKIYAKDNNNNNVYSNLVTITQDEFVPDYAELPFEFDGGRADIATTTGLTQDGLDSDYSASPKLKFKTTGTWVILKFNEAPGLLSFDILGNSFSGGTFTIQTSVDGETYSNLKSYTELGAKQHEEFSNLASTVRYIRWIYTEKSSGNVGVGNIKLTKAAPESVSLTATLNNGRYWTTFYNSSARYTLSEGQAFIMDDSHVLYRLGDDGTEIPANTAVVIIANSASITLTKSSSTDTVDTHSVVNILEGSDVAVAKPSVGTTYVLGVVGGAIGFYEYTATDNIPAAKAFYVE